MLKADKLKAEAKPKRAEKARNAVLLHWRLMEDLERRMGEERARVAAEYRRVLESSVEFEKRIRNRWRAKCREKNHRIAELEERVAELERWLGDAGGR